MDSSVRVALRIRPQLAREKIQMYGVCTSVAPGEPQVFLGNDRAFTYDYVYEMDTPQTTIYESCVLDLVEGCFDGYNATVLAYGQTGSGKTYTMGTGFEINWTQDEVGIIPRAVHRIFQGIEERRQAAIDADADPPKFSVSVQFVELYHEEVLDLIDSTRDGEVKKSNAKIHESAEGEIYMSGVITKQVHSMNETLECLKNGALSRTTGSTNMNAQSSRSHAIFSVMLQQQRMVKAEEQENGEALPPEIEMLTAKFHFVDLAGSERLKRTGATGDRAKESISINSGLLALGNVISALGDASKKVTHVPYRDSKLTRLLQDSLGGNSRTLMIACISPSDCDFTETLNTLNYANRARNIKNKVTINQDKTSRLITMLRAQVQQLEVELLEFRQGKRMVGTDGGEAINDQYHENVLLQAETKQMRIRIKALQETVETVRSRNAQLMADRELLAIRKDDEGGDDGSDLVGTMIKKYMEEIEELRSKLCESEATCDVLRRQVARLDKQQSRPPLTGGMMTSFIGGGTPTPLVNGFGPSLNQSKSETPGGMHMIMSTPSRLADSGDGRMLFDGNKCSMANSTIDDGVVFESSASAVLREAKGNVAQLKQKTESLITSKMSRKKSTGDGDGMKENGEMSSSMLGNNESGDADGEGGDEDSESESDVDEIDEEAQRLNEELAELQSDISIKERLVEELEQSQKRMQALRKQYEHQLSQLQVKIQQTEMERERVLQELGARSITSTLDNEKVSKVKSEYEKRLAAMRADVQKLQSAQREHTRLMRQHDQQQAQTRALQSDLQEMKKTKVQLLQKLKEESNRSKTAEKVRSREVAQLKKEQRKQDLDIKRLEMDRQRRELMLQRKQEEIAALRKLQTRPNKGDARVMKKAQVEIVKALDERERRRNFSPKAAKHRWTRMEQNITSVITKRKTLSQMEMELERQIQSRDDLRKRWIDTKARRDEMVRKLEKVTTPEDEALFAALEGELSDLEAHIEYINEKMGESQRNIMQIDEVKNADEKIDHESLINDCKSVDEAKYLLEHLYSLCLTQGMLSAQTETKLKELEQKYKHAEMERQMQQKLLIHCISSNREAFGLNDEMINSMDELSSAGDTAAVGGAVAPGALPSELTALAAAGVGNQNSTLSTINGQIVVKIAEGQENPSAMIGSKSLASARLAGLTRGDPASAGVSNSSPFSSVGRSSLKARRRTATTQELLFPEEAGGRRVLPTLTETRATISLSDDEELANGKGAPSSLPPSRGSRTRESSPAPSSSHSPSPDSGLTSGASGPSSLAEMVTVADRATPLFSLGGEEGDGVNIDGKGVDCPTVSVQRRGSYSIDRAAIDSVRQNGADSKTKEAGDAVEFRALPPASRDSGAVIIASNANNNRLIRSSDASSPGDSDSAVSDSSNSDIVRRSCPTPRDSESTGVNNAANGLSNGRPMTNGSAVNGDSQSTVMNKSQELPPRPNTMSTSSFRGGKPPPVPPRFERQLSAGPGMMMGRRTARNAAGENVQQWASPAPPASGIMSYRQRHSATTTSVIPPAPPASPESRRRGLVANGGVTPTRLAAGGVGSEPSGRNIFSTPNYFDQHPSALQASSVSTSSLSLYDGSSKNVFSRLTSSSIGESPEPSGEISCGTLKEYSPTDPSLRQLPLTCTFVAEGHYRGVLCVAAREDMFVSGSKDRYIKVWSLGEAREVSQYGKHPNNVVAVRLLDDRVVLSASLSEVRLFDMRDKRCIKCLSSSGLTIEGSSNLPAGARILTQNEPKVTDVAILFPYLFVSATSQVRIWDLRKYKSISKLNTGHSSQVDCISLWNGPPGSPADAADTSSIFTGSKDHTIKRFQVQTGSASLQTVYNPVHSLEPPHYDGIQCLAANAKWLFSGSRNSQLKKWSMDTNEPIMTNQQAHKDALLAMCFLPSPAPHILGTACRGGVLKLWDARTMNCRGEIRGHASPINALAANSRLLFTASSDCSVGLWKPRRDAFPLENSADDEPISDV